MERKLRVGVIFGGRSGEHEISLRSARSIVDALDRARYEPVLLGIDPDGRWHLHDAARALLETPGAPLQLDRTAPSVAVSPGESWPRWSPRSPRLRRWALSTWSSRCSTAPTAKTGPSRAF